MKFKQLLSSVVVITLVSIVGTAFAAGLLDHKVSSVLLGNSDIDAGKITGIMGAQTGDPQYDIELSSDDQGDLLITTDTGDVSLLSKDDLIIGGVGNTYNENVIFDFETTANTIGIGTGTGVTGWDWGTLNLVTTGTLGASGAVLANGVIATTQSALDNSTKVATTAYVDSAAGAIALDDLTDVALSSPTVDNVLKYNGGNWTNASSPSASGTVGTTFYSDDIAIIATGVNNDIEVNSLLKFPNGTVEDVHTISVTNNTVLGETYLYNTALGGLTIDAGEWLFNTYASVNSVTGARVSSITRNMYHVVVDSATITTTGTGTSRTATASSGTPFVAGDANAVITDSGYLQTPQGLYQITGYTSATVVTVETPSTYTNEAGAAFSTWKKKFGVSTGTITALTTNYESYLTRTVQSEISIAATDKLAEIVFGVGNNTTDIYFVHNGTEHYSNFRSPLVTRHNDLPGLNVGDMLHLSAAQKTIATQAADTTLSGYLLTADWDTFNDKAEANLSNLSSVAINTSLLPGTEDSISWGSATKEFLNGYIGDAGKLYFGLAQDGSIHRSALNELTLTASAGVKASKLTISGDLLTHGLLYSDSTYGAFDFRDADQTPWTTSFLTGTGTNALLIHEYNDKTYDFLHAQQTNPTIFINSASQSATEWISFTHDQTDGLIDVGTGNIKMNDPVEVNGGITLSGTIVGVTTAITGTQDNLLSITVPTATGIASGLLIGADAAGGAQQGGILTLRGGAGTPDGYVRITDANDLPTQTLDDESLFIKGKLEVDGSSYFDGTVWMAIDNHIGTNTAYGTIQPQNSSQTPDAMMLLTGASNNSIIIAEYNDSTFDFAHADPAHPSLFIHSTNQATDEWISFFHSGTNSVINSGKGGVRFLDPVILSPSSTITYLAAEAITVTRGIMRVAGNGGSVTLTSTPNIVDGTADGVCADIVGTNATNTLILQDADNLANSGLALAGDINVTLGLGDVIRLCYDSGDNLWKERYRVENIDD